MAIIAPFRGLTYNLRRSQDFSRLVAPPYDVISEEEQDAHYEADPHNVIRLILGRKKIGDSDWDNRYTRAADFLKRWESGGILIRAKDPCLYVTSITYEPGNGEPLRTRWGLVALVRIEDPDSGVILPHERTFSAHKDDRLKLMRTCMTQFSQIFALYEDPSDIVMRACKSVMDVSPEIEFRLKDGTKHQMWVLEQPALFKEVANAFLDKPIYIADGHHRYESSVNFRNIMRTRYGRRPANRPYEYVMTYLSNISHEGLTILPSHRLIKKVPGFQLDTFLARIRRWFDIRRHVFSGSDLSRQCATLKQDLKEAGSRNTAIASFQHEGGHCHLLLLRPEARAEMGSDLHPSLQKLDVLALSRFVLQKGLGFSRHDLDDEETFHYQSSMETAISQVQSGQYQMAFLLNHTKIEHVKEIAGNALVMPRKSTYFYPKVLSGLVFNKIVPHEIVQTP
jgi:uncharacterized protein (DUF1015 family)